MAKSVGVAPEVMGEGESITNSGRVTTHIGFCLMLSWHYLLLFSPGYGDIDQGNEFEYLFLRQLALYIALAVAFYVIWAFGKWRVRTGRQRIDNFSTPTLLIGLAACAASFAYVAAPTIGVPVAVRVALIAVLGVLQAYCMVLWVRCLMNKGSGHVLPSFGIYMIVGGTIALLVCFFQWPVQGIVTSIIPLAAAIMLTYERNQDKIADSQAAAPASTAAEPATAEVSAEDEADGKRKGALSPRNRRTILFAALFALTFGLLQGSFIVAHIPILIVNDAVVLVGIIMAGLLIHIIPKNLGVALSVDMMHRFSLILFVMGSIVITWYELGSLPLFFSQILLLAGFNLFDFGVFAYGIEGHWEREQATNGADFARPIVYLGMTSGLLVGRFIVGLSSPAETSMVLLVICGVAVIAMVATTLMPLYHFEPAGESEAADATASRKDKQQAVLVSLSSFPTETFDAARQQGEAKRAESPWRSACRAIAKWYQLSPRETEIFMLVAKGRNADYIQQELTISTHTAKTHIANIYHKLDVHSMQEVLDLVEKYREENEPGRATA